MRRYLALIVLLLSVGAQAQVIRGTITNFSGYGSGFVCRVPQESIPEFNVLLRQAGSQTSHFEADDLMSFFYNAEQGRVCFKAIELDGSYALGLPGRRTKYTLFFTILNEDTKDGYWQVNTVFVDVDGKVIPPTVIVTAPKTRQAIADERSRKD